MEGTASQRDIRTPCGIVRWQRQLGRAGCQREGGTKARGNEAARTKKDVHKTKHQHPTPSQEARRPFTTEPQNPQRLPPNIRG
eukprot:261103-Chlamydomonas_euryale.AAC.2